MISDFVLWGAIVLVLAGLVFLFRQVVPQMHRQHGGQTITLYFEDANQLAVGSPVNFMGSDIGFVTQVKPEGNRVMVRLKTYPDAVGIPSGSHFTVEFNGLAGAKTLEVLPPGEPPKTAPKASVIRACQTDVAGGSAVPLKMPQTAPQQNGYIVDNPIRLRDVMRTQVILADALESSSINIAQSLGEMRNQRVLLDNLGVLNQRMLEVRRTFLYAYENLAYRSQRIHLTVAHATDSLASFQQMVDKLYRVTQPAFFKTNTMATLRYFMTATQDTYRTLQLASNEQRLKQVHGRLVNTDKTLRRLHGRVSVSLPRAYDMLGRFNQWIKPVHQYLQRVNASFLSNPPIDRLHRIRETTRRWSGKRLDF